METPLDDRIKGWDSRVTELRETVGEQMLMSAARCAIGRRRGFRFDESGRDAEFFGDGEGDFVTRGCLERAGVDDA